VQYEDVGSGKILTGSTDGVLPRNQDVERQQMIVEDLVNLFQVDVKLYTLALPPKVQEAINTKLVHEQNEESYAFRLSTAVKEKERKKIEAEGIRDFQSISGISILAYRGIEATEAFANSKNSKIVIIGTDQNELPILMNGDTK
jgi:regulator of protease activity HflC (stomatin/prohibitin superfamily)